MSTITIEEKTFDLKNVKSLYPAVLVKTGYDDTETTEMSLAWVDIESKGRVEVTGYGIFVVISDEEKHSFLYPDRETLNFAMGELAQQLK
ncbi:MAG: Phosphomannomutase [uncultured Sulfurovum sp.]|uniref:Phosphomannomutase n=1 Tax=uncultured Sulfurovum sp. TaxID=269237 RepID=A0A6S6TRB0_9BACT|nr:MAG: Phosphomannomutase [uncultured Sulfurovum sp.]